MPVTSFTFCNDYIHPSHSYDHSPVFAYILNKHDHTPASNTTGRSPTKIFNIQCPKVTKETTSVDPKSSESRQTKNSPSSTTKAVPPSSNKNQGQSPRPIPVDVRVFPDCYEIIADLPGIISKEHINVDITEQILTISADRAIPHETTEVTNKFLREEIKEGKRSRSIALPKDVDFNQIEGKYENGVVRLILKKIKIDQHSIVKKIELK